MKSSLEHLPANKQEEILMITRIITEVVNPEKVILFGSYAKGEQVEDRYVENGTIYEYRSDYDLLVVTQGNTEKEYLLVDRIVNKSRHLTPVAINPIIHEMEYVNEGLRIGQYFFTDIIKEGVLLYDSSGAEFEKARPLTREEQKEISQRDFDRWFSTGNSFLKVSEYCLATTELKTGVFLLHQATESFYNTVLLVFTGYKPKTHSLEKLRQYAKPYSKELLQIFPDLTEDKMEFHLFDLLKRGFIDARYKLDYVITVEELRILIEKVRRMKEVVERICVEKIQSIDAHTND